MSLLLLWLAARLTAVGVSRPHTDGVISAGRAGPRAPVLGAAGAAYRFTRYSISVAHSS